MKILKFYLGLFAFFSFCFFSCGKKMVSELVAGKQGKSYDAAAYNFIYVEAIKQKLMGNGGDALKYLEQCTKINPESDAAYYQMAQIVINNGDVKSGKKYAAMALSIDSENLWYLMMMAGIYYQEKNIDSAIIYYEKAVKYFPDKENLQLTLGNLYSENKNFQKAISIFNSLDERYGVNESSTLSAIRSLISAGRYDEALVKADLLLKEYPDEVLYNGLLAEIYRGKGENDKAIKVYEQLIEKNPDNAQTQLAICDFLITQKNYDELFLFLNTVILNVKVTREDKITLILRLLEQSEIISDQSDHLMLALMVLEANYKDDEIFVLFRPELLIKEKKLDEASVCLEEIIRANPNNYYAWEKLLLVYYQMKRFDKLTKRGEDCATLFNRSFLAKILYANGAMETGKFTIALEELRKAEILAGNNKDSLLQVLTMKADVYYKMKDYKKAFELFEESVKTGKEDLTVLNNYAYYLAEQNMNLKEAEKMSRKVIELEKGNNTYLDTYGWVLYKRGKLSEAAKIMEKIINSGEEPDAVWYEHYGFILKKQKNCIKAIENWNIAIKIDSMKTELAKEIKNCEK
jgi:tetratricopeptide (TPR) repeat protein